MQSKLKFQVSIYYFILITMLIIASCAKAPKDWNSRVGRPYFMRIDPKQYELSDNDWKEGFNDGCVTAMEVVSAGINRINSPRIDGWKMTGRNPENPDDPHPVIKSGPTYTVGYMDGYEHCTYQYDWWVL